MTDSTPGRNGGNDVLTRRHFLFGAAACAGTATFVACSSSSPKAASKSTLPPTASPTSGPTTDAASTVPLPATVTEPATSSAAPSTIATVTGAPAVFVDHGSAVTDMVALTFHLSGKPSTVTALLDLLQSRSVTVTAFAVGTWITANPEITRRLVDDGHELANHTEHHLDMGSLTRQQVSDEIVQCGQALVPFIGSIGRWFRPSATVVPSQLVLDEAGRAGYAFSVGYDVDSVDNKDPGAAAIVSNVDHGVQPGAIVSLHFGHPGTIEALPHILDNLTERRLRPVTLGTMLG